MTHNLAGNHTLMPSEIRNSEDKKNQLDVTFLYSLFLF